MIINIDGKARIASSGIDGRPWLVQRLGKGLFVPDGAEPDDKLEWRSTCNSFETLLMAVDYVSADIACGPSGDDSCDPRDVIRALRDTALAIDHERQAIVMRAVELGVGEAARSACRLYDHLVAASTFEFSADGKRPTSRFDVTDAAYSCRDAAERLVLTPLFEDRSGEGGGA